MRSSRAALLAAWVLSLGAGACRAARPEAPPEALPEWERAEPLRPLPDAPLGIDPVDWKAAGITPGKVRLGRWLFHDTRLSADGTVSCATCHQAERAFSEDEPVSTGVFGLKGTRKSPPIVNPLQNVRQVWFWDGRAASLAEQAKGPIANPVEMAISHERAVEIVSGVGGYRRAFRAAYGDARIDIDRIADAIAAWEATLLSGGSKWDRFNAGDESALSPLELEGRDLFFGAGRCNACHLGANLTDARFHNVGVGYDLRRAADATPTAGFRDLGRYVVTGEPRDLGAFKTPPLRDVSRHAPYMHDGSVETLEEAVFLYVQGGVRNPWLAPEMDEVRLVGWQVRPLVAFLRALDGDRPPDPPPRSFPR
jgi:cytochrome c peroxidase